MASVGTFPAWGARSLYRVDGPIESLLADFTDFATQPSATVPSVRSLPKVVPVLAALGAAALCPGFSQANGRFPAAQLVQLSPDGQTIALRLTFGFALSDDGGQNFRWICEDVLGYGAGAFDPSFVLDASRRLFVGAPDGLARLETNRCEHARVAELDRAFVIDLDRSTDGQTLVAITSSGAPGAQNRIWRSNDSGAQWSPLGAGLGPETLFETVELARSNSQRVYATAVRNNPRSVRFFRSDDGGATLADFTLDAFALDDAFIAAVDPSNADVIYVRGRLSAPPPPDAGAGASPTALLVSRDGGRTFNELARTVGAMNGFAISDDGQSLWIGSTHSADGLQRSTDRGATWSRVNDARVTGLRFHNGTLWVAANWVIDRFALGRSVDGGRTITPALGTFCDLRGAPVCPPSSDVTAVCGARWSVYRSAPLGCPPAVDDDASAPMLDAATPRSDAAVEPPAAAPGCRCAAPSRSSRSPRALTVVSFALSAIALARRARRAQRAPERCD